MRGLRKAQREGGREGGEREGELTGVRTGAGKKKQREKKGKAAPDTSVHFIYLFILSTAAARRWFPKHTLSLSLSLSS